MYNEQFLKIKIKSYGGKSNTDFHSKEIPQEGSQSMCLPVVLINSVCKTNKTITQMQIHNKDEQIHLLRQKFLFLNMMITLTLRKILGKSSKQVIYVVF